MCGLPDHASHVQNCMTDMTLQNFGIILLLLLNLS